MVLLLLESPPYSMSRQPPDLFCGGLPCSEPSVTPCCPRIITPLTLRLSTSFSATPVTTPHPFSGWVTESLCSPPECLAGAVSRWRAEAGAHCSLPCGSTRATDHCGRPFHSPSGLRASLMQPEGRISLTAHDLSLPSSDNPPRA